MKKYPCITNEARETFFSIRPNHHKGVLLIIIIFEAFLAKHNIPVVLQIPYLPDLAPCDFWLFTKLKMPLKGTRFHSRDDMRNAPERLLTIPKTRRVSNNEQGTLREVCITKQTTLKEISVSDFQINKCISCQQGFNTF